MRGAPAVLGMSILLACLFAGCASTSKGPRPSGASSGSGSAPGAGPAKRGGGYYEDDGPGENPPENLDQLPDAVPRVEPYLAGANRPYAVFGREYVPDTSDRAGVERGIGSWYGRKFNGQRTSSGEIYDMYAMTAAHPTLPIPSYARVTNPANGRSVIVRINDRGPFHPGRIIDLSFAAAYRLGYTNVGSTALEVERLLPRDIAAGRYNPGVVALASPPRQAALNETSLPHADAPAAFAAPGEASRELSAAPLGGAGPSVVAPAATSPAATSPAATSPAATSPAATSPAATSSLLASASDLPADLVPPETVSRASAPTASGDDLPLSGHYLQLAAFRVRAGADGFLQHLTRELDPALATHLRIVLSDNIYRVQLGPYNDRGEAQGAANRLRDDLGIATLIVAPR